MILIINSGSIKNKAENNINIESSYHLYCMSLKVLFFHYENSINIIDNVVVVG